MLISKRTKFQKNYNILRNLFFKMEGYLKKKKICINTRHFLGSKI